MRLKPSEPRGALAGAPLRTDRIRFPWGTCLAIAAGLAAVTTFALRHDRADPQGSQLAAASQATTASLSSELLDPGYVLGGEPQRFGQVAPLAADLRTPRPQVVALAALSSVPVAIDQPAAPSLTIPVPVPEPAQRPRIAFDAPLPERRPSLAPSTPQPDRPQIATPVPSRRTRAAEAPAAVPAPGDNRTFFERLFGGQRGNNAGNNNTMVLAYAPANPGDLQERPASRGLGLAFPGPAPTPQAGTAIYDITAQVIYMPNGERLEAHSGLGPKMDDPRHAHVRMQGPTPPHTYDLTERESLFHGHRALRLSPVGGSRAIHGRAGLLAHPYLLGPRGDSNGCVSIKDYNRFLQAYLRGEVRRLVVVARS